MDTTETPKSPGRRIRPLLSLQRHWRVGLVVACLILLLGIPLVWIKGQSTYVAESVFQVYPTWQKNLVADREQEFQSNAQYRQFVNHLSRSVVRYDVIETAVQALSGLGCLPAESRRTCIERLQRVIYVLPVPDTYMVRVGLTTSERGQSDQVINKVMEVFLATVRDEQIYGAGDRATVLVKRSQSLRQEIIEFEVLRTQLAGKLGLTTFSDNVSNPYDAQLAKLREQHAQVTVDHSVAKASLRAFEAKQEVPMQAGRSVLDMRLQDSGLQALRNEAVKRTEELNRLLAGLEPSHPAYAPAQREREEIAARLKRQEGAFEKVALDNVRARLHASLMQAQQVQEDLSARLTSLESRASTFASDFRSALALTAEIRKRDQELNEIRDRGNFLKLEQNAIGFARLIAPALPAIKPSGVGKVKLALALVLTSLLSLVLVPVLIDRFDRRVIAVSDAEKVMGITSAAWFVEKTNQTSNALSSDQYKRFASALVRNRSQGADSVFVFTAARVGGGCTGVVSKVASQLSAQGARVLVVDANTLAPHSPLNHGGPGLTDHLLGKATLADIVVHNHAALPGVDMVGVGTERAGGIQGAERLRAALQTWKTQYDLVLLDAPPLLPSADAALLVDTAKQVFLVVEASGVSKTELAQVRSQLARQAPDAVGLLVNKVSLEQGSHELQQHILEGLTGGRFSRLISSSSLRLNLELMWIQLRRALTWRQGNRPAFSARS